MSSNRMIARHTSKDGHDDFPTPPWATRALLHYVLPTGDVKGTVWEPAAGREYMSRTLREKFPQVVSSDIIKYHQRALVLDFLVSPLGKNIPIDWVITNPPYKLAELFFHQARRIAHKGVALLVRLNWLQNGGRYERIFKPHPPAVVAQFAGRIPAAQGRVIHGPAGYFQHCWVVWYVDYGPSYETRHFWIPPEAQKKLERDEDYAP